MIILLKISWVTWDLLRAFILGCYGLVLACLQGIWRTVCLCGKFYGHMRVLTACGGLSQAMRLRIDQMMGHRHLALQSLEQLIGDVERYHHFHKERSRLQKLSQRVLLDLYEQFFGYALRVGDIHHSMACIIRAKKNLGVDELSGRLGITESTAQLLQVALSAAHVFDDNVVVTVFYRGSSTVSATVEGSAEASAASTQQQQAEESLGKVIPFPVRHFKPSSCLSSADRDKQT